MKRAYHAWWLALPILFGHTAPAIADTEFKFAGSHRGPMYYEFVLTVTVVLNEDETAARISVQPEVRSTSCISMEVCHYVETLAVSGLGMPLPLGTDVMVPLTETQVESLLTGRGQFAASVTLGVTRPWLADPASFTMTLAQVSGPIVPPMRTYLLAEGATGAFFTTELLILNPNAAAVGATLTCRTDSGAIVEQAVHLPAWSRHTIPLNNIPGLDAATMTTHVRARSNTPLVIERTMRWGAAGYEGHTEHASQYWPGSALQWTGAHSSVGVNALSHTWGLAEGRVGGPEHYQTYLLLANVAVVDASVTIRFVPENGAPFDRVFAVPALSRLTVAAGPGLDVPELQDAAFGADITSTVPIAVERSMYWDAGRVVWAAGTNASGTRFGSAPLQFPF